MEKRSFGTHDGTFHADDVSACALLLVFDIIDKDKVVRTREPKLLDQCEFVCDVGGIYDPKQKRFDHHQNSYTGEFSSAGMIWRYLFDQGIVDESLYEFLNRSCITGVDAHDNGKVLQEEGVCTFSHIIANLVPIAHSASNEELDSAFMQAVEFAKGHYSRLIERYHYILNCKDKVAKAMKDNGPLLLFDEPIAWQENFFDLEGEKHPALFLIMPTHGQWKLRGIPPNLEHRMDVRMPHPISWAGLRGKELQDITGIEGAIFCHKGQFISVWKTKEDALKAFELVMQMQGVKK